MSTMLKIGVGVGVGTAVCIATLKGAMHLCDACYKAGKKLQNVGRSSVTSYRTKLTMRC